MRKSRFCLSFWKSAVVLSFMEADASIALDLATILMKKFPPRRVKCVSTSHLTARAKLRHSFLCPASREEPRRGSSVVGASNYLTLYPQYYSFLPWQLVAVAG